MSLGEIAQFFGGQGFDPNSVTPAEDFDALPAGKYPVLIEKAGMKGTKAGDGHYLELQFLVLDGPAKGRKLWDRLNIDNKNPTAVEIALRALSALCKATIGDVAFTNENQLLQQTCMAHVKVGKDGTNSIRTYSRIGDAQAVQSAAPLAAQTQIGPPPTPAEVAAARAQPPQQARMAADQPAPPTAPAPPAPPTVLQQAPLVKQQPPSAPAPVEQDSVAAPPGAGLTAAPAAQPKVPWAGQQPADTPPATGENTPF